MWFILIIPLILLVAGVVRIVSARAARKATRATKPDTGFVVRTASGVFMILVALLLAGYLADVVVREGKRNDETVLRTSLDKAEEMRGVGR